MKFDVIPIISLAGNAYIIKGRHVALVDTMAPSGFKTLQKGFSRAGLSLGDVEFILITHNHVDHVGNAAEVQKLSGAVIIAGDEDVGVIEGTRPNPPPSRLSTVGRLASHLPASWLDRYQKFEHVAVDRLVGSGDTVEELGLEVIGLPGHTVGGVGYLDRDGRRAFIGDMVSYWFSRPGMPALLASASVDDIHRSQALLADMGLQTAYPGHGKIMEPDASRIIELYLGRKKG